MKYLHTLIIFGRVRQNSSTNSSQLDDNVDDGTNDADEQSRIETTTYPIRSSAFEREVRTKLINVETKMEVYFREDREWKKKTTDFLLSLQLPFGTDKYTFEYLRALIIHRDIIIWSFFFLFKQVLSSTKVRLL